ncbi:helix-turn-helix transcriptional regulator [Methylorubrum sp. SL192]|uniref:helix-turn-helix transcriptional regulator n=1 Tax=Methylorubrum sp. SL192 TaxID=2995167 RepID=UPI002277072C|nr:AlpA family phage regulatory protein [Methylorubrum sp. SL192]MCY1642130.1 AlpA family phage regulatory protein [Methylorubrum sp. SL192]
MSPNINAGESCPADNRVVRFRDACAEAGVSIATMRRYLSAGRGPRLVRLSERVHGFRRRDLNAWIEDRTAG